MTHDATYRRTRLNGAVDFTMMYVAHDAFARDLRRIAAACARGETHTPAVASTWSLFKDQLLVHHRAEDVALWPQLRKADLRPDEVGVLDAMEAEHARIDPGLEEVDRAMDTADPAVGTAVSALAAGLAAHMRHEETSALPLIETYLGKPGWGAFARHVRNEQGLREAPRLLPWLLDGASVADRDTVLGMLPGPARIFYRTTWAPRYRRKALSD